MKRVLMTGAGGAVARMVRPLLRATYPEMVLSDLRAPADLSSAERFTPADLARPEQISCIVKGIDGIIHFAGHSVEGDWPAILRANIEGAYNLFEMARRAGVKRVVFASSNHAVGFYRRASKIGADVTPRPDSRYGLSKAFGELLGALYADKYGMAVTCLRIGNVAPLPIDKRRLAIWLHPEDLAQLLIIGLEHPAIRFEILYGMSDNSGAWWDNARALALGYRPRHRSGDHRRHALQEQRKLPDDPVGDLFQGGSFCSAEFTGDKQKAGR